METAAQMINVQIGLLLCAIAAFVISFFSAMFAKKANRIAEKAISVADKANRIAEDANSFAKEANDIAGTTIQPRIDLIPLFAPNEVQRFTFSSLKPQEQELIRSTTLSMSMMPFRGKNYWLVNLCYPEMDFDETDFLVGVFTIKLRKKSGLTIKGLDIIKGYSMETSTRSFPKLALKFPHLYVDDTDISYSVAYIKPIRSASSLNLRDIESFAKELKGRGIKEPIDLTKTEWATDVAKVISLDETGYLVQVTCEDSNKYLYSGYLRCAGVAGRAIACGFDWGDKEFSELAEDVNRRAREDVIWVNHAYQQSCKESPE